MSAQILNRRHCERSEAIQGSRDGRGFACIQVRWPGVAPEGTPIHYALKHVWIVCPAASHFSCLAKKSNQKKATPLRHPFGAGLD